MRVSPTPPREERETAEDGDRAGVGGESSATRRARGRPTYRLSASVRLPWLVGLVVFLVIAAAIASLVGRTSSAGADVPRAVSDSQATMANAAAQGVRRSLNEAVVDLTTLVGLHALDESGTSSSARARKALGRFTTVYDRYAAVGLESATGSMLAAVGPDAAKLQAVEGTEPGLRIVRTSGGVQINVFASDLASRTSAVAEYDASYLHYALDLATPASAWIVDSNGLQVLGPGQETAGTVALVPPLLRSASEPALRGQTGSIVVGPRDDPKIISYAPVAGAGPAGSLGWAVVTERRARTLPLPQFEVRRQALLAGLVVGFATVLVFAWLYLVVFHPLFRLQSEADRIAYGDLRSQVQVVRYDEIGFIARALERTRVLLIRQRGSGREGRADR